MAKRKRLQDDDSGLEMLDDEFGDPGDNTTIEPEPETIPEPEPIVVNEPPPVPPANVQAPILLRVFAKIAGPKWDQMAGFIRYAKNNKLGPRTVPEWRATYNAFLSKPVK